MKRLTLTLAALGLVLALAIAAAAAGRAADGLRRHRGRRSARCPSMFTVFPEAGIAGAWAEFKSVQLNPDTALDGKTKELIGLAVAVADPVRATASTSTPPPPGPTARPSEEIKEAVAMAAIVRHWSTVLNGMQVDPAPSGQEVDAMMAGSAARSAAAA